MISKIAQYKVKENELETVLGAIRLFVANIAQHEPNTFYEAFQLADRLSFTHIMEFADQRAEEAHSNAPYTQVFVNILYPRCESAPMFTDLNRIASTVHSNGPENNKQSPPPGTN